MNKTHTQQDVADAIGVSQSMVSKDMKAAGIPSAGGITLADVVALVQWRTRRDVGLSGGVAYDYEAERARLTHEQANKVSLEVSELRGELVRSSEVGPFWADMVSSMRAKLVGTPSKIAALIADPIARAKVQAQSEAFVYEALAEIEKDGLPDAARERYVRSLSVARNQSGEAATETNA
jgi:hypothetical protein